MNKFVLLFLAGLCSVAACNSDKDASSGNKYVNFEKFEAGTLLKRGDSLSLAIALPDGTTADSIRFDVDGTPYATQRDSASAIWYRSEDAKLGSRQLSATVYAGGEEQTIHSNIVVVASKAPQRFGFKVVETFPHDEKAYTQGLEYHNGFLYESTGQNGSSSIRKVELNSGKVLQRYDLPEKYFGEGLTIVGDKLIQLTWREGVGFVYNLSTFGLEKEFPYQSSSEGWGICYDGERLIKSDGSHRLYFLNKDTFREEGFIEVYNQNSKVENLNELEYIDGKVYANVYYSDALVVIDPQSGEVEQEINLIGLLPQADKKPETNVLNGIAYDRGGKRLLVTGKNWDKLFHIEPVQQ